MKKLLFLIPNLKHGGAEKVLVNLANHLDPEKYAVTVQTLFDVGVHRAALAPHVRYLPGYRRQFRGNSHIFKLFSPEFLYRHFVKEHYDVVISYLEGVTARIISACPDPDTAKICWIHTELMSENAAAQGFRSIEEARRCYSRFDRVVGVSRQVRDRFLDLVGRDIPSGVLYNTNDTDQIFAKAQCTPEEADFLAEGIKICAIGRVNDVKGFDRLLSVHKRLLKEGFPHRVYIIGTGKDEEKLRQSALDYGVADTFRLLGFRENPYPYVSRSDLFVCSSRREGFSTAVTEALILGVPVVSTDCSGAKELLGEQDEYGIVTENSEEGVYQGMKRLLSDPALLVHYQNRAKERGPSFSKAASVAAVEAMLAEISPAAEEKR